MHRSLFFLCVFGFLAGIFARSFVAISDRAAIWVFITAACALAFSFFSPRLFSKKYAERHSRSGARSQISPTRIASVRIARIFLVVLIGFSIGIARYAMSERNTVDPALDQALGARVRIIGVIADEPEKKISTVEYVIGAQRVVIGTDVRRADARLIASAKSYQQFSYGDLVEVTGTVSKPQVIAESDGAAGADGTGSVFDYPAYLSLEGIYYQLSFPSITLISHGHGNPLKAALFSLKDALKRKIESQLPEPHAALLEGILLGDKKALGNDLEDQFRAAGVIHIVILSGYSINIIASSLGRMLALLPLSRFAGFFISSLFIALFALMSGGSSTVVRASIMAIFSLFAVFVRRDYRFGRILVLTVFLMALYNPKILAFDVSFQISLLSVIGLAHFSPLFEKWFAWVPERLGLRETVVSTVSTQVFVLPFILHEMGQFSVVSVPVNIAILFLLPFTMLAGLSASTLAFVHWTIAWPFSVLAYFSLQYMITVVRFASGLPFAVVSISVFPWWLAIAVYLLYAFLLWRRYRGTTSVPLSENSVRSPPS